MAKEKQPEPIRKGAEPESPPPIARKFGNYAAVFLEEKLQDLMHGRPLKGTGINTQDFYNCVIGYGLYSLQQEIENLKKELGA